MPDCKAQFQQFAVDARSAPKWVLITHAMNEVPQFAIDLGPAAKITGFPTPPSPETRPVSVNYGIGTDNGDGTGDTWEQPVQPDE